MLRISFNSLEWIGPYVVHVLATPKERPPKRCEPLIVAIRKVVKSENSKGRYLRNVTEWSVSFFSLVSENSGNFCLLLSADLFRNLAYLHILDFYNSLLRFFTP